MPHEPGHIGPTRQPPIGGYRTDTYSPRTITVSFSEKSRGWESFKSFLPETGFSLNNDYYTGSFGILWKHHSEDVERNSYYTSEGFRNTFSSVTVLFNQHPSTVKSFNALNYEGSKSQVVQNLDDSKFYNNVGVQGWFVPSIITDLQSGTVYEFLNKEGKWFNHIMGEETDFNNSPMTDAAYPFGSGNLDSREFSTQGIGIIHHNPIVTI